MEILLKQFKNNFLNLSLWTVGGSGSRFVFLRASIVWWLKCFLGGLYLVSLTLEILLTVGKNLQLVGRSPYRGEEQKCWNKEAKTNKHCNVLDCISNVHDFNLQNLQQNPLFEKNPNLLENTGWDS